MNIQYERCGFAKTRLRHPSLPFDSFPYPARTICRHVRSVNHVTTKRKEVDHILRVWGSVPSALRARGSPAIIHPVCSQFLLKHCVQFLMPRSNGKQLICKIWGVKKVHYKQCESGEYKTPFTLTEAGSFWPAP